MNCWCGKQVDAESQAINQQDWSSQWKNSLFSPNSNHQKFNLQFPVAMHSGSSITVGLDYWSRSKTMMMTFSSVFNNSTQYKNTQLITLFFKEKGQGYTHCNFSLTRPPLLQAPHLLPKGQFFRNYFQIFKNWTGILCPVLSQGRNKLRQDEKSK